MEHSALRERDLTTDLESGGTTSEEDGSKESVSGVRPVKKLLGRVWNGVMNFDGSIKSEDCVSSCNYMPNPGEVFTENLELLTDKKSEGEETVGLVEKKMVKEKRKKASSKKPPRPPRGPSLDAADQKLVREISELAMLKRARNERMKELKKMKATKTSSSNSNLLAMIITILFCFVIIFQGMCSRNSSRVSFEGSPESAAAATNGGLISVQYYKNFSANSSGPGSSLVEKVSGSDPEEEVSRVAG
ncbi:hypothetical protein HHK36_012224 [Tetracentron sinense]|uniref:Transmembrane protein n=1 Tax=Tetracentron sinense TaxID=13715 RepID=A0A834Z8X9_TETSI|nr:hypothetical protein HHK36_012224 [Tetracentron sinense]